MATTPANLPHQHVPPSYGAKAQYTEPEVHIPLLDKIGKTEVQAVTGTLLYYARAVNPTILVALNAIATEQANPTQQSMAKVKQLLDYCAPQEEAIITYRASDMILSVHSDAGYLNKRKSQSRVGGHFYLSINVTPPQTMVLSSILQKLLMRLCHQQQRQS